VRRHIRVLLFLLLLVPATASAGPITSIHVFGDSLADQQNAFLRTGNTFPPPPYAQRASNGPVAVEYLAAALGVPLLPSQAGGTNYAVVGALTGPHQIPNTAIVTDNSAAVQYNQPSLFNTGLGNQVAAYLATGPVQNPANSLFVVWGGPNDFFVDPSAAAAMNAVNNLVNVISALYGNGARMFLVPNMADLSLTPSGLALPPLQRAALQQLSIGFDLGLAGALDQLQLLPGIQIVRFNTFALLTAVSANPIAFGFSNATTPCLTGDIGSGGTVCNNPASFVFWDSVHPTTAADALLGAGFASAVQAAQVPEPATLSLLGIGAGLGAIARRRRGPRCAPNQYVSNR
jgi:phospholipase/lecithinase/hemolysin